MKNVIFVLLDESSEGRYSYLAYIVDPGKETPEDTLARVRRILTNKPLGAQSQPIDKQHVEWNTYIVDLDSPHHLDVERMERCKVRTLISFSTFEEEIQKRLDWTPQSKK